MPSARSPARRSSARPVGREQDRRPAGLRRGRLVRRVLQGPRHVRALGVPEHRAHDLERVPQPGGALGGRAERDAVGAVLGDVRARPQPDDQAPVRDHVEDRRHLGRERRGPVAGREHRDPQPRPARERGERGQGGEGVEGRLGLDPPRRLEVVVDPEALEAEALGAQGEVAHLGPRRAVLRDPDPDRGSRHSSSIPARGGEARPASRGRGRGRPGRRRAPPRRGRPRRAGRSPDRPGGRPRRAGRRPPGRRGSRRCPGRWSWGRCPP